MLEYHVVIPDGATVKCDSEQEAGLVAFQAVRDFLSDTEGTLDPAGVLDLIDRIQIEPIWV